MRYIKVLLLVLLIFFSLVFFFQNQTALSTAMTLKLNLFFVPEMTSIPLPFYFIVIVAIGQPSARMIVLAIGAASWPVIARLVRAEFRTLREADFVLAARSLGYRSSRIIFAEILPNALPPVIVTISVMVASAFSKLKTAAARASALGSPARVSIRARYA